MIESWKLVGSFKSIYIYIYISANIYCFPSLLKQKLLTENVCLTISFISSTQLVRSFMYDNEKGTGLWKRSSTVADKNSASHTTDWETFQQESIPTCTAHWKILVLFHAKKQFDDMCVYTFLFTILLNYLCICVKM